MKLATILLISSFFTHAAGAVPMWKWRDKTPDPGDYGAVETGEKREMKGRALSEEPPLLVQQRAAAMSAAVDRTISKEKEDLTIDSSEELINQKSEEALSVAQKWSAQMERKSSSINEGEITAILQEATADLDYWNDQKKKISSWLGEDGLEETKVADLAKGALFLQLSTAASMAIEQAYNVAACYASLLDTAARTKLTAVQSPLETGNPLIASWPSDFQSQQLSHLENNGQKLIKSPSKESPLTADTLKEALETWCGNAEIKYDVAVRKYKSDSFQPNNMFDAIRYAAGRSQQERKQNRDTIEKVALEGGADYAVRFKSYFSIRVKNAFGEPLTPELIEKVQKNLRLKDARAACNASDLQFQRSVFNSFLQNITARWNSFREQRRVREQYEQIPEDL